MKADPKPRRPVPPLPGKSLLERAMNIPDDGTFDGLSSLLEPHERPRHERPRPEKPKGTKRPAQKQ